MKLKVKTQVQDDQVRVTAEKPHDLQAVIAAVRRRWTLPIDRTQFVASPSKKTSSMVE